LSAVGSSELTGSAEFADVGVIMFMPDCLNNYLVSPNKLLEYINADSAVLCNDSTLCQDIVAEHEVGGMCQPDHVQSTTSTINGLNRESKEKSSQRQKCFKYLMQENQEPKISEVYDKVLSGQ